MMARHSAGVLFAAALIFTAANPQLAVLGRQSASKPIAGVPTFEVDRSWPKVPAKWKLGDASSVAVDRRDHVWLLHRPRTLPANQAALAAPPVLEFDAAGNFVQAWGGPGTGFEWPEREHGLFVDHSDNVWIGGNNCPANNLPGLKPVADDQLLKFTTGGKFVMQIGRSNASGGNSDTRNFHQPADVVVHPKTNELFVADGYGNHRMIVLDASSGAFKRMWGAFGNKPADDAKCPRPPAPPPIPEGQTGPPQFAIVHAARVSNDGFVYVADREYRRVQVFTRDGKYIDQVFVGRKPGTGGAGAVALSADPQQELLYVGGGPIITMLDRKTLALRGTFGGKGILEGIHHMAVDSKGNVYIAALAQGFQKATRRP
jgi:DNA-binding beta-propeller fold protein YncE